MASSQVPFERERRVRIKLFLGVLGLCAGVSFCGGQNNATSPTPSGDTSNASSSISTVGGRIASDDSRLTLTIPAGAVSEVVDIRAQSTGGFSYELTPDGTRFATPVTASLEVPASEISFANVSGETSIPIVLPTLTDSTGDVQILDSVSVNRTGNDVTMSAEIDHFSQLIFIDELTPPAVLHLRSSPLCTNQSVDLKLELYIQSGSLGRNLFRAEVDSASASANGVPFIMDESAYSFDDGDFNKQLGMVTTKCNAAGRIDVAGNAAVVMELDVVDRDPGDDPFRQILVGFSYFFECDACGSTPPLEPALILLSLKKQTIEHTVNETPCPTKGKPVQFCSNVDETLDISTSCSNRALNCVLVQSLYSRECAEVTPSFDCSTTMSFDDAILIEAETAAGKKFRTESEVSVKIQ